MNLIFTCDWHISDDTPEDLTYGLQIIRDACALALAHKCSHIVVAGDFFHYKHKLSPRLLVAVQETLRWVRRQGVGVIVIPGNHDRPDSNDPNWTPLLLFKQDCILVNESRILVEPDCVIAMVPWFAPDKYREEVKAVAHQCLGHNVPRILISHVSIQEGKVSPSNTRLTTPIKLADLLPGIWNGGIYLGDYHAAQELPGAVGMYGGAPAPKTFGDFDCLGMWRIGPHFQDKQLLQMPTRHPQFKSWRVDEPSDLPLQGYDSRDKNRVFVNDKMAVTVSYHYPGARLVRGDKGVQVVQAPRLLGGMVPVEVALRWRQMKSHPEALDVMIKEVFA